MSYLVLARKYRPRSFSEMVGQEHVVQALGNALTQQRLHHAYLFTGTRGVGKTTVSRILAKSLNCTGADGQGGITAQPCGVCDACRDIDAGRFVDYVELDAASNRGVEEISQLLDQSVYKPVVGRFKVYMIDEVHMLSTTAFNAMLKTLEEPPEYLKFVLATTDPQKVPVTVLSRCLQFNLRPMAPVTIVEHLQGVLAQESLQAEPGALRLIARGARGSMRDALSLTDQAIAFGGGALAEAGVRQMLGTVDRSHVLRIVEAVVANDGAALVDVADTVRREGLSAAGTLEELAQMAQQMAVLQAVPEAGDPLDPDTPALQALAGRLPADETQLMYSIALHGRAELGLAPDEYAGLTMVLLRLLAFRPDSPRGADPAGSTGGGGVAGAGGALPRGGASGPATPSAMAARGLKPGPAARTVTAAAPAVASTAVRVDAPVPPRTPPIVARRMPAADDIPPWEDIPPADLDEVSAPDAAGPSEPTPRRLDDVALVAPVVSFEPDPSNDDWVALVRRLLEAGTVQALTRELAVQSQCVRAPDAQAETSRWILRVERESLRQPSQIDKLARAVGELVGRPVEIDVQAGVVADNLARREAHAQARAQSQAEEAFRSDPRVRDLLQRFPGARIVPGSVRPA